MTKKIFGDASYSGIQTLVSDNVVGNAGLYIERAYTGADAAGGVTVSKARGSVGSKSVVVVGDRLAALTSKGWDGSAYVTGANFETEAKTVGAGICSQDFVWRQQPAAGGALAETMRLEAAGNLSVSGNAFVQKNNTAGPTYMAAKNLVAGTGGAAAFFAQSDSAYIEFTAYSSTFSAGTVGGEAMADAIRVTDAPSIPASKFMLGTTGASPLHLITNDTKRITISSTGLVGIGVSPVTDLDITKSAAGAFVYSRIWNNNAAANSDAQMQVLSSGGSSSIQFINYDSGAKAWSIGNARSFSNQLFFGKSTGITGNLAISLDYNDGLSEGRLGVNKTSPGYPLDVLGKAAISAGLGVWGKTPPAAQPAKINDPSGGTTIDAEARSAINALIDVLEGAGLSAAV